MIQSKTFNTYSPTNLDMEMNNFFSKHKNINVIHMAKFVYMQEYSSYFTVTILYDDKTLNDKI